LGVSGWVRNRPEGTVEVLAEGSEEKVSRLIAWCHEGPSAARVDRVQEFPEVWQGQFDAFEITYG
jgi:acylphosphatase